MLPETLEEAEAEIRRIARARASDAIPPNYPAAQIVALCKVVSAMLDDLRQVPMGEGTTDGR